MLITLGAASPTVIPSMAATLSMPVTITNPVQEALAAVFDTPTMVKQELSVPETILPATIANNESQFSALYLNNHVHQVIPNSDSFYKGKS